MQTVPVFAVPGLPAARRPGFVRLARLALGAPPGAGRQAWRTAFFLCASSSLVWALSVACAIALLPA